MDWSLYRFFLAVAQCGSLSGAARQLGVSQPTVGRQIQELEGHLGARLFDRVASGYVLTETGEAIVGLAKSIELSAVAIERRIAGEDQSLAGSICLCAPEGLGNCWLVPKLAKLRDRHPEIDVDLVIGMSLRDLVRREADVALRIGNPGSDELIGRRIAKVAFGLYASEAYLSRYGAPRSLGDLSRHTVIGSTGPVANLSQVERLQAMMGETGFGFSCNTLLVQFSALQHGLGLLPIPHYMAHGHPELHRVLEEDFSDSLDLWLLTHRDLKETARIRTVLSFLGEEIGRDRQLLLGEPQSG